MKEFLRKPHPICQARNLHVRTPWFHRFFSHSHDTVIRLYDEAGNVIETHEHKDEFKEW
jgi:hypothetical protein